MGIIHSKDNKEINNLHMNLFTYEDTQSEKDESIITEAKDPQARYVIKIVYSDPDGEVLKSKEIITSGHEASWEKFKFLVGHLENLDGDDEDNEPPGMTDVEADADTLASAGHGTDEDYGFYGDEN